MQSIIDRISFDGAKNNLQETHYRVHFNPEKKQVTAHVICKNEYGSAYDCDWSGATNVSNEEIAGFSHELSNSPFWEDIPY